MSKFLLSIGNNSHEWYQSLNKSSDYPRLPLLYGFGSVFHQRGHQLLGLEGNATQAQIVTSPFTRIYPRQLVGEAIRESDLSIFWGGDAIRAIVKQSSPTILKRKVILSSYIWELGKLSQWKMKRLGIATHLASKFAKGVVVMTSEQQKQARQTLPVHVPVLKFTCGIDTGFYRLPSDFSDVPEIYRLTVDSLLKQPYVIMPGDEQRCHSHALDILSHSNLNLVRISQYTKNTDANWFRQEIYNRGLENRCFFFEKISYPFLRFLLHNASAYAGLVDSTWQPAGWTVACEAIASGLPVVLYEGLVSRELEDLGASRFLHPVKMGDTKTFQIILENLVNKQPDIKLKQDTYNFAAQNINLEITAPQFAEQIEKLILK